MPDPAPLTLGTAGHIDHGKTELVRALTGRHTDRLPEERRRGISIELGYAPLELASGRRLSVVDVPGHERFVRTMVAGASGIDMFLLCIAADDGVMPQTLEHLAVLRGLGVTDGVVAVTKSDIGEPDLVAEEAAELLPDTPILQVSAQESAGLGELVGAVDAVAARLPGRAGREGAPVLHVDRSFSLKGIGTVVTGTLWRGRVTSGDRVSVLPRGMEARVRSVQVHDVPVEAADAGQRVALNLAGVGWRELGRGDVVAGLGAELRPTYLLDVTLEPMPESGTRLHVHHGTREAPARVIDLGDGYAQLRLEAPLVAEAGDRVVLRRLAPADTLGGGVVVDAHPRKHRKREQERQERRGQERPQQRPVAAALDDHALRLAALLRADGFEPRTDSDLAAEVGLELREATRRLGQLVRAGQAVRVARNLHYHPEPLSQLEAQLAALLERDGRATIASVRDELGTSRKYAQALLEHLDAQRVTRRDGDVHVLRPRR